MSAHVVPLEEDTTEVRALLEELLAEIAAGRVVAAAFVTARADGGLDGKWGATRTLGPHAGSVLRGAVAYLGARMDATALTAER
jgi:hypothetical protein